MKNIRRSCLPLVFGLLAVAALPALAQADFPSRPIKIIVPYPAGGLSDFQVRAVAEPLGKLLGQTIIVDNRPGASAAIGTQMTAAAPPDGYTMVFVNNGFLITPLVNPQAASYDPIRDFAPVSVVSTSPMVMVVNATVPVNDVKGFIDYAKKQPGGVEYGSAGPASFGHVATAMFSQDAGLKMTHVPYKGEAPMSLALRSGEVKVLITTPSPTLMGAVKAGTLKVLGVASAKPAAMFPGIPPIANTLPGFKAEVWFGLFAPKATPPETIAKLNAALVKVLAMPDIKEKFATVNATAESTTPAAYAALVKAEYAQWAELIAKTGIKAE